MHIRDIKHFLNELGLNEHETRVYIALAKLGEARASHIAKLAEVPRTTAISILAKLERERLITSHIYKGVTTYWIESPQSMEYAFEEKLHIAKQLNTFIPLLYQTDGSFPIARIFDTKAGIKKHIIKILEETQNGEIIFTIDTPYEGNYVKIFPEGVGSTISRIKEKRGIITQTLVPFGAKEMIQKEKIGKQNIHIKELPKKFEFHSSLWLVGKTLFLFSGNPPFLVSIQHKTIVDGFKGIFHFFWESAEK